MNFEYEHIAPGDIEKESMRIIGQELSAKGIVLDPENEVVIKRCIHTSADFDYAENLAFSQNAVSNLQQALRDGAYIVTDTQMAYSGISKRTLAKYGGQVLCFMSDEDVAAEARARSVTRASVSMEKAARLLLREKMASGEPEELEKSETDQKDQMPRPRQTDENPVLRNAKVIFAVGNAPTALLKLRELMDTQESFRPAGIIGVPVGFVNVISSKELIRESCEQYGIPYIVARGRKGGSNIAAAIVNALLYGMVEN